jgi:hypothetical protein
LQTFIQKLLPEEMFLLFFGAAAAVACSTWAVEFEVGSVAAEYAWLLFYNLALIVIISRGVLAYRRRNPRAGAFLNTLHLPSEVTLVRSTFFLIAYLTIYSNIKTQIPMLNGGTYDQVISQFESSFLGDPVGSALSLKSYPWLVELLDRIYHHQYLFMTLTALLLFLNNGPRHFRHLFFTFALLYLVGITISAVFPVVGPAFVNPDDYAWMEGLRARKSQGFLGYVYKSLVDHQTQGTDFTPRAFAGIAALPSLHVGHCMVLALFAWHYHRKLIWIYAPMVFLTWLATLVLGWHYLVDGIAVIPLVWGAWWVSQRVIFGGTPASRVDPVDSLKA